MSDHKLRTITSAKRADPGIVAMLEGLLARAKAGELIDLVAVWTTADEYDYDWITNSDRYGLAGYMTHVQNKIVEDPDGD